MSEYITEDGTVQQKAGFFGKVAGLFGRTEFYEEDEIDETESRGATSSIKSNYRYTVTVRRQIVSLDDAYAAANGLKSGEQQIVNLTGTDPDLRNKIVDFLSGVNFATEGTWEPIGEHIYLIVPISAYVQVVPPSPRSMAQKN